MWSEKEVELLVKLVGQGLSASKIAARIGGVTRNAVIGKIHRLGLCNPAATKRQLKGRDYSMPVAPGPRRPPKDARPPIRAFELMDAPAVDGDEPPASGCKSMLDLDENDCRWPFGAGPYVFCAAARVAGQSYCAGHTRLAFAVPEPRKVSRGAFVIRGLPSLPSVRPAAGGPSEAREMAPEKEPAK